jgi:hypothetical protein
MVDVLDLPEDPATVGAERRDDGFFTVPGAASQVGVSNGVSACAVVWVGLGIRPERLVP